MPRRAVISPPSPRFLHDVLQTNNLLDVTLHAFSTMTLDQSR